MMHERRCHGYTIVTDAREPLRRYFTPGPFGTPRAAAHGSLVLRLGLLWTVVLCGGHVELLMAAQGKGGGGPAESPGLTSPVYFSNVRLPSALRRKVPHALFNCK